MVRCFIGIFIPEECKEAICRLQEKIKRLPIKCKFVERENLHISLSFLGEISEEKVRKVERELGNLVNEFSSFKVKCKDILFIPNKRYFRVLALDVKEGRNILIAISNEIKRRVGGDVKPPHLTLCRVKKVLEKEVVIKSLEKEESSISFIVESIDLVKSTLSPKGPIYQVIKELKLP
ncbi:MAG TPA: RNA 2',3'-cyclic phosphodiesterase [Candidatus Aenigmarchaeota archaeon]|nr:RNA 2',3'-cyclic phosphodiesterase [Candidatus Aenigmarchaeota archaeon]